MLEVHVQHPRCRVGWQRLNLRTLFRVIGEEDRRPLSESYSKGITAFGKCRPSLHDAIRQLHRSLTALSRCAWRRRPEEKILIGTMAGEALTWHHTIGEHVGVNLCMPAQRPSAHDVRDQEVVIAQYFRCQLVINFGDVPALLGAQIHESPPHFLGRLPISRDEVLVVFHQALRDLLADLIGDIAQSIKVPDHEIARVFQVCLHLLDDILNGASFALQHR
mmetsp:Transcript_84693/g.215665  ORF Transcript_84693/g.215665 Transcript_84693/m.215665 type:complete len:220 (+) Transcript_84693:311-970(+)